MPEGVAGGRQGERWPWAYATAATSQRAITTHDEDGRQWLARDERYAIVQWPLAGLSVTHVCFPFFPSHLFPALGSHQASI